MKQNVSPAVFVSVIVVVVAVVGLLLWRVMKAPSSVPAPGTIGSKPVPPSGGIPPEAFKARDEWRRTHPESAPGGGG